MSGPLNDEELVALSLFSHGKDRGDVAYRLRVSPEGIDYIRNNAIRKLEATSLDHAVAIAIRRKLIR